MLLDLKIFARSVYKVEHMFSRVLAARAFSLVMCLFIFSVCDSVKTFVFFLMIFKIDFSFIQKIFTEGSSVFQILYEVLKINTKPCVYRSCVYLEGESTV